MPDLRTTCRQLQGCNALGGNTECQTTVSQHAHISVPSALTTAKVARLSCCSLMVDTTLFSRWIGFSLEVRSHYGEVGEGRKPPDTQPCI